MGDNGEYPEDDDSRLQAMMDVVSSEDMSLLKLSRQPNTSITELKLEKTRLYSTSNGKRKQSPTNHGASSSTSSATGRNQIDVRGARKWKKPKLGFPKTGMRQAKLEYLGTNEDRRLAIEGRPGATRPPLLISTPGSSKTSEEGVADSWTCHVCTL